MTTPDTPFRKRLRAALGPATVEPTLEHNAQVKLLKEVKRRGVDRLLVFSVPNAAKRSMNLIRILKAEGLMPGVSDLIFIAPPLGRAHCLEMKKAKGGATSDNQRFFARVAKEAGAKHAIAAGYEEAVAVLEAWGLLVNG